MYIMIHCKEDSRWIFPCDFRELEYAMKFVKSSDILETWPNHGHGAEWRIYASNRNTFDQGVMILDMNTHEPMTKEQLKQLGVLQ